MLKDHFFMPMFDLTERKCRLILSCIVSAYFIFFFSLAILRYFTYNYFDWDLADYDQIIWNLTQGRFYSSLLGVHFLGHHAHFLAIPVALIYKIFPHALTLIFLQTAALAGAAYPLYFLARFVLGCRWALLVSIIYLLYHGVGYTNFFEFHFTCFVPVLTFSFLYFFYKEKYSQYLFFALLILLCQENLSLVIISFGVYAAILRKPLKWWLPLLIGGTAYFLFCVKVLLPGLNPDTIKFITLYDHWGRNYGEIVRNLVTHPLEVYMYVTTPEKLSWVELLLRPLSYVPLLSPFSLLAAGPIFLQRLLSNRPQETMINLHYTSELIPFLFLAFIMGIRKLLLSRFISERGFLLAMIVFAWAIISAISLGPFPKIFDRAYLNYLMDRDRWRINDQFVRQIPQNTSVVASFEFLSHLSRRERLYSFHSFYVGHYILSEKKFSISDQIDYGLINFNDIYLISSFYNPDAYKRVQDLLSEQKLKAVDVANNTVLFKKNSSNSKPLYEEKVSPPVFSRPLSIKLENNIELKGYDSTRKGAVIEMAFYWLTINASQDDLGMYFDFIDEHGQLVSRVASPMCYGIFPTQAWRKGQWVADYKYLIVPSALEQRTFELKIGFYRISDSQVIEPNETIRVLLKG